MCIASNSYPKTRESAVEVNVTPAHVFLSALFPWCPLLSSLLPLYSPSVDIPFDCLHLPPSLSFLFSFSSASAFLSHRWTINCHRKKMNANIVALHSSPVGPKRFGGMDGGCRSMPRRTVPPKGKMANCKFHEKPLLYLSTRLIAIVQRAFQKGECNQWHHRSQQVLLLNYLNLLLLFT